MDADRIRRIAERNRERNDAAWTEAIERLPVLLARICERTGRVFD